MKAGGMSGLSRTVAQRYAPLLAIIAMQFLLVLSTPDSRPRNVVVQEGQAAVPPRVNSATGAASAPQPVTPASVVPRTGGGVGVGPAEVSSASSGAARSG